MFGRPRGNRGQPPLGRVASGCLRLHLLTAISPDGKLHYIVREGPVTAEVFREFLEQIAKEADRKVLLVVNNRRIHCAQIVREWLAASEAAIELYFQPTYSSQINPVELL